MSGDSPSAHDDPTVLVVDDERDLADLYTEWLTDSYAVCTAYDGAQALELLDEVVDVVLLDRRMPDLSGDAVLERIRSNDLACRVAMVTAVEPDFDIVEMGFDDYLTKPVSRSDLVGVVEQLTALSRYDEQLCDYFTLVSKKAALDTRKSADERIASDEYARLERELAEARDRVSATVAELDDADIRVLLREGAPLTPETETDSDRDAAFSEGDS